VRSAFLQHARIDCKDCLRVPVVRAKQNGMIDIGETFQCRFQGVGVMRLPVDVMKKF